MAGRPIKLAANADAVNVRALRRVTEYALRQISHMLSPNAVAGRNDISWRAIQSKFAASTAS
jgi:hypothetical protein